MPPIQGYTASVEAARQALEVAQTALPRDVGQAVMAAGWTFLRDRHDVNALIDHVTSEAESGDFVSKLHAAADKARQQQPQRGRPPKANSDPTHKHVNGDENSIAATTI
ncbi:DNA-binding protein [Bradyrhizobium sp. USDA 3650]